GTAARYGGSTPRGTERRWGSAGRAGLPAERLWGSDKDLVRDLDGGVRPLRRRADRRRGVLDGLL
ncbi:MAG: hypothetical protein AVDCRST_MAG49-4277, partial [uncultured Thermomicrobiales bacterium]